MACDNLRPGTFKDAMGSILKDYNELNKEFKNGFTDAINALYDAWKSTKGYNRIGDLYQNVGKILGYQSSQIYKNYNTMYDGAMDFARKEEMANALFGLPEIGEKEYEVNKKTFPENGDIEIDEEKLADAGAKLTESFKNLAKCINNSFDETSSDDKFGYYSSDEVNPRERLHGAYNSLKTGLDAAAELYQRNFEEELEQDKEARAAARQASAVNSNDISDVFGNASGSGAATTQTNPLG